MEDVLDVYRRPFDPRRPRVCLDETSKQLTKEVRAPLPHLPGRPAREDYEYERNGVAEALLVALACSAPPAGRARWTLRLLADELVALEVVDRVAPETVRRTLKKTSSSRG